MTTATSYVRKATADGALLAPFHSPLVRTALAVMSGVRATGQLTWCRHLEDLTTSVALWPLHGPDVETLVCPRCWRDPGRSAGCLACSRRPAPGLRQIVSPPLPRPDEQVVVVGQLCSYDRRTLA